MAKLFTTKPESEPSRSIVLGTFAVFMQFFGYHAPGTRMLQYPIIDGRKKHSGEETKATRKAAGFSEWKSDHHPSKPWITASARK